METASEMTEMPVDGAGGVRRRRRVEHGGRPIKVTVRFTAEEFAPVAARAAEVGLTPASYLAEIGRAARSSRAADDAVAADAGGSGGLVAERVRPLGVLERRALARDLCSARRLLAGAANNLNQLTRVGNAVGELPPQVNMAAAVVTRYLRRFDAVLAVLEPRPGTDQ